METVKHFDKKQTESFRALVLRKVKYGPADFNLNDQSRIGCPYGVDEDSLLVAMENTLKILTEEIVKSFKTNISAAFRHLTKFVSKKNGWYWQIRKVSFSSSTMQGRML